MLSMLLLSNYRKRMYVEVISASPVINVMVQIILEILSNVNNHCWLTKMEILLLT